MSIEETREVAPGYSSDLASSFTKCLLSVREELKDSPYISEALKVMTVGGYRSAIGNIWNAVVDDLRNKVLHRSISLFNKEVRPRKEIKRYEDFQDYVNDDELIDGAYKIGVISWEASKILKHAKETRHIFDGHPKSSDPSPIKVLGMMEDCIKYVLSVESPPQIIDIDEYISTMNETTFSRNVVAIENALGDLPEIYKSELVNRILHSYVIRESSSTLKGNIEFISPILWNVLPKEVKIQIVRHLDTLISKGDEQIIENAFKYIQLVGGDKYLSTTARKYKILPIITKLETNLDNWSVENECIYALEPYAPYIPQEIVDRYVTCLILTYVGTTGSSYHFARTDFYANGAAVKIPLMMDSFDDNACDAFVNCVQTNEVLRSRIHNVSKLRRLQTLARIVQEKASTKFRGKGIIDTLLDDKRAEEIFRRTRR